MVWPLVAGAGMAALGGYLTADMQKDQMQAAAQMSERASAFTQLMGLNQIDAGAPGYRRGLNRFVKGMRTAGGTMAELPGVARAGQQEALGQIAGSEAGAVGRVKRSEGGRLGTAGQAAAAQGFYGSSVQESVSDLERANTNQAITDIMGSVAGAKAGVIQQGSRDIMEGLMAQAQGEVGVAQAEASRAGQLYNVNMDKLNTILQTGHQFGVDEQELLRLMAENPNYQALLGPGAFGGGDGGLGDKLDPTGFYKGVGDFYQDTWDTVSGWF